MKNLIVIPVIVLGLITILWGAFEEISPNAYRNGLATVLSLVPPEESHFSNNPACLFSLQGYHLSADLLRPFNLKELYLTQLSFCGKIRRTPIAFKIRQFRWESYQENLLILAAGVLRQGPFQLGVKFQLANLSLNHRNYFQLLFSPGVRVELSSSSYLGIMQTNVLSFGSEVLKDEYPQILSVAISHRFSERFTTLFELYKDTQFPLEYRLAGVSAVNSLLSVLAGYDSGNHGISCGLFLHLKRLEIIFTASIHPFLPVSPSVTISSTI